jgi:chromosome segregation ATPase
MPATAETLLDFLKSNPNPMRLPENFTMVTEAYQDLLNRVVYLEKSYLEQRFNEKAAEARIAKAEDTLRTYDADHVEVKKRVDVIEKEPATSKERVDKIEERLRAVEGATGQRVKDERDVGHPDKPATASIFAPATPVPEKTPA